MMVSLREAVGSVITRSPTKIDVLCVGLCTVDIVHLVKSYPQQDSDVRCMEARWQRGGNASNDCTVLSQLGLSCEFLGTLSKESHLTFLIEDFNRYKINTEHCVYHSDCEAPLSTVILSLDSATRTIIHSNASLPELMFEDFKSLSLNNYPWVHFEGRNVTEVLLMMEHIDKWNLTHSKKDSFVPIKISLELEKPKPDLVDLIPYADIVFVGKDFAKFRGCNNMSEALKSVAKDIKNGATIICAWGDLGAMAREPNGGIVQSPAFPPRKVIDTLGAGDTFCATVIFGLVTGKSLRESISLGCQIAGAKIGHRGFKRIGEIYRSITSVED